MPDTQIENGIFHRQHLYRLGPLTPVPAWRPRIKDENSLRGKSVLEKWEVERLQRENEMSLNDLLQALVAPAAELALPYLSGFYVGAAALGSSGRVYFGANMEFPGATLASSVHAEQSLTANLLRHKEDSIHTVAISAPPCGHCRQFFSEMTCVNTMKLIFGEGPGNVYTLADILPHRFGPFDLLEDKSQPLLLQVQTHSLSFTTESLRKMKATLEVDVSKEAYQEAAALALKSADESYSPYTRCPAGVAIISDKGVHSGGIVENAAHNPTLQPLQAAFINARFEGLTEYNTVEGAVLVEVQHAPLQQFLATRALLQEVAPQAFLHVLYAFAE